MKTITLFSLLIAAACTFQSCQSPESRASNGDSTSSDSAKADTGAVSASTSDSSGSDGSASRDVTNLSKVDSDESDFMKTAALGGMMEVELGKIAQKSTNAEVRAFAAQMVTDHTKANNELKALAEKKEVLLPTAYPADQQAHLDMMKNMKGVAFDRHYIDMMVTDHDKTVALFKGGVNAQTKEVSDFAKKTLPVIMGHDERAKAIKAEMK